MSTVRVKTAFYANFIQAFNATSNILFCLSYHSISTNRQVLPPALSYSCHKLITLKQELVKSHCQPLTHPKTERFFFAFHSFIILIIWLSLQIKAQATERLLEIRKRCHLFCSALSYGLLLSQTFGHFALLSHTPCRCVFACYSIFISTVLRSTSR